MESEIVGRTRRAKDKSPVEREACVAVVRMRHKERREKRKTAEERERRSAAGRLRRKLRLAIGKETADERGSRLDNLNRSDIVHRQRRGATVSSPAGGLRPGLLTTFSGKALAKGAYLLHPHVHRIQFYYHFSLKDKCLYFWITACKW